MTDLRTTLRVSGRRMTAQRAAVYEALCARTTEHPTAEELFLSVCRRLPGISLATVYNTLETLVANGMVTKIPGEGAARYDSICDPHGHTRCLSCGSLNDLPHDMSHLLSEMVIPQGFVPHTVLLEVEGVCPDCARSPARAGSEGG